MVNNLKIKWIQMRDSNSGWLGVNKDISKGLDILYTNDSAKSWKTITPKNTIVISAFPFDIDTAFLYGLVGTDEKRVPTIFFTENKGDKWNKTILPIKEEWERSSQNKIVFHFKDIKNGWLLSSENSIRNEPNKALYKTTDQGKTWIRIGQVNIAGYVLGISFINDNLGFIAVKDNPFHQSLFKTLDGGKTWIIVDHMAFIQGNKLGSQKICYKPVYIENKLMVPVQIVDESTKSLYFYVSKDLGQTWEISMPIPYNLGGAFSFVSSNSGWIIDADLGYLYSINQKRLTIKKQDNLLKKVHCLHFIDNNTAWSCTSDNILYTNNRGNEWIKTPLNID